MRIIAGIHRTRQIDAPEGLTTRPMTDRVRENLFNLLGDTVGGATVLDLFCGSGALGLEALSRGAARGTFVDADLAAVNVVEANCRRLGLEKQARILRRDVLHPGPWIRPVGAKDYTLVFVDPPYKMSADPQGQAQLAAMAQTLVQLECIARGALVMLRAERGTRVGLPWAGFELVDGRSYGTTTLYLMTYAGGA
ncbi:MAG: 16S rRNA (guanine(966)-N(2))-methyltransferase RsmD [Planctomycetota bacterium]|nr:16S rRNA (guanine(966)-N(2))-methyltransferase RsmD [Planctomycetota bacterium]